MNIPKVLSTRERMKILENIIFKEGMFGVCETAKELGLSKSLVSQYFDLLLKEKIIKRIGRKFKVRDGAIVRSLKILFNIQRVKPNAFKKYKSIVAVGLYGSCAKGTNTESSDVDIWIKVDKIDNNLNTKLASELRKRVPNANILWLDNKRIKELKKKDPLFYYALYFGSIILIRIHCLHQCGQTAKAGAYQKDSKVKAKS